MCKSWEDYDKNRMHFVYKLDHLFWSVRVLDENSSLTTAFHFSKLFKLKTFFAFNMHHAEAHTKIWTLSDFICYFSCIQWFILCQMTLKMESIYRWTQKRLKLGMVSSFYPYNMCAKVERVMTKTGCTSYTNSTISFEVWGF